MAQLVEQWKNDGGIFEPGSVFMLASLNSEVKELNLRAQAERIRAGEVNPERKIHANGVYFHEGDRLQFQKNSRELGVSNSDTATILAVNPERKRISVRLDQDDREITVSRFRTGFTARTVAVSEFETPSSREFFWNWSLSPSWKLTPLA